MILIKKYIEYNVWKSKKDNFDFPIIIIEMRQKYSGMIKIFDTIGKRDLGYVTKLNMDYSYNWRFI